jgi:hypothetical protein
MKLAALLALLVLGGNFMSGRRRYWDLVGSVLAVAALFGCTFRTALVGLLSVRAHAV